MDKDYGDIIHLPHPAPVRHPRMAAGSRAAQFSPFAALTGYEEAVREQARLTEREIRPDEHEQAALDEKLRQLRSLLREEPPVTLTYFVPDGKKAGGSYRTVRGGLRRIDPLSRTLFLTDGREIPLSSILTLESDCLPE